MSDLDRLCFGTEITEQCARIWWNKVSASAQKKMMEIYSLFGSDVLKNYRFYAYFGHFWQMVQNVPNVSDFSYGAAFWQWMVEQFQFDVMMKWIFANSDGSLIYNIWYIVFKNFRGNHWMCPLNLQLIRFLDEYDVPCPGRRIMKMYQKRLDEALRFALQPWRQRDEITPKPEPDQSTNQSSASTESQSINSISATRPPQQSQTSQSTQQRCGVSSAGLPTISFVHHAGKYEMTIYQIPPTHKALIPKAIEQAVKQVQSVPNVDRHEFPPHVNAWIIDDQAHNIVMEVGDDLDRLSLRAFDQMIAVGDGTFCAAVYRPSAVWPLSDSAPNYWADMDNSEIYDNLSMPYVTGDRAEGFIRRFAAMLFRFSCFILQQRDDDPQMYLLGLVVFMICKSIYVVCGDEWGGLISLMESGHVSEVVPFGILSGLYSLNEALPFTWNEDSWPQDFKRLMQFLNSRVMPRITKWEPNSRKSRQIHHLKHGDMFVLRRFWLNERNSSRLHANASSAPVSISATTIDSHDPIRPQRAPRTPSSSCGKRRYRNYIEDVSTCSERLESDFQRMDFMASPENASHDLNSLHSSMDDTGFMAPNESNLLDFKLCLKNQTRMRENAGTDVLPKLIMALRAIDIWKVQGMWCLEEWSETNIIDLADVLQNEVSHDVGKLQTMIQWLMAEQLHRTRRRLKAMRINPKDVFGWDLHSNRFLQDRTLLQYISHIQWAHTDLVAKYVQTDNVRHLIDDMVSIPRSFTDWMSVKFGLWQEMFQYEWKESPYRNQQRAWNESFEHMMLWTMDILIQCIEVIKASLKNNTDAGQVSHWIDRANEWKRRIRRTQPAIQHPLQAMMYRKHSAADDAVDAAVVQGFLRKGTDDEVGPEAEEHKVTVNEEGDPLVDHNVPGLEAVEDSSHSSCRVSLLDVPKMFSKKSDVPSKWRIKPEYIHHDTEISKLIDVAEAFHPAWEVGAEALNCAVIDHENLESADCRRNWIFSTGIVTQIAKPAIERWVGKGYIGDDDRKIVSNWDALKIRLCGPLSGRGQRTEKQIFDRFYLMGLAIAMLNTMYSKRDWYHALFQTGVEWQEAGIQMTMKGTKWTTALIRFGQMYNSSRPIPQVLVDMNVKDTNPTRHASMMVCMNCFDLLRAIKH